uniref:Uncharacterized protein n=1 Tax=Taeniopygia guttata TaxID=59729 RepID=A0A674GHX2_TAEGU
SDSPQNETLSLILYQMILNPWIAPKIKQHMTEEGLTMVTYQPQDEKDTFFRIVFSNPASRKSDVYFLLEKMERLS